MKQYPYFARYAFAANSYRGISEEVLSVGVPSMWIAHKTFSAETVQRMTAAVYSPDGHAHMMKVHAGSKDMVPEKALGGITIPLHAGAEAHWRAARVPIPDAIRAR
jgi:hypothetical protein